MRRLLLIGLVALLAPCACGEGHIGGVLAPAMSSGAGRDAEVARHAPDASAPADSGGAALVPDSGASADAGVSGGGEDAAAPPMMSDDLQHCVDVINMYRATVHVAPVARSTELEAYAAIGAREDGMSGQPHGHFARTNGGGIAFAENEIPQWPMDSFGTVRDIMDQGSAQMWGEGPGGGHYENMRGRYTEAACGIYVSPNREVTIVQDFR